MKTITVIATILIGSTAFASRPTTIIPDARIIGDDVIKRGMDLVPCQAQPDKLVPRKESDRGDCRNDEPNDEPEEKECGSLEPGVRLVKNDKDCATLT